MTQIRDIGEANEILMSYIPQVKELLGKDITFERIRPLMEQLGNPQEKLQVIHLAGTSGKTSTAYFLASLLKTAGCKVGLTVSPHIDSVTERIQINLEPLSEKEFCESLAKFIDLIQDVEPRPTYFELLIAFAYWYFAEAQVDYAVIETGMGGMFDATNIVSREDKVCVITDIGFDHMHVLGNTIAEIAEQKAGIIQQSNQVFMYAQGSEVDTVFQKRASGQHAILNVLSDSENITGLSPSALHTLPAYQQRNWLLASYVYVYIQRRDNLPQLDVESLVSSLYIQVPGRMDIQNTDGKRVVMDGAHNEQKIQAFVSSFQQLFPDYKVPILLSLKQGKEYQTVLPLLKSICSELILTSFETAQDLPIQSIPAMELAEAAREAGMDKVVVEPDLKKAYATLMRCEADVVIITGSFYLLSQIRPFIIPTQ